ANSVRPTAPNCESSYGCAKDKTFMATTPLQNLGRSYDCLPKDHSFGLCLFCSWFSSQICRLLALAPAWQRHLAAPHCFRARLENRPCPPLALRRSVSKRLISDYRN